MCNQFWWPRRCPSLDFFWVCVFILDICKVCLGFSLLLFLLVIFDISARLYVLILAGSIALHVVISLIVKSLMFRDDLVAL